MMWLPRARFQATPLAVLLLASVFAALASLGQWFASLDRSYYDFLLRQHLLDYPNDIVIVAIDEVSLDEIGAWPWSRDVHAQLLEQLQLAEAVVFDIIFSEPSAASAQINSPSRANKSDNAFAQSIAAHKKVVLPVFIDEQQYRGLLQEVLPLPVLSNAASALGHVHLEYSQDGLVRGVYLGEGLGRPYWQHVALATAKMLDEVPDNLVLQSVGKQLSPYQIYQNNHENLRFVGPANSIYRFSYIDVLNGSIANHQLKGKRVFVGASAKGLGDDVPTPMGLMPGVEFIANAYQAVRQNGFVNIAPPLYKAAADFVVVLLVCSLLGRLPPLPFLAFSTFFGLVWVTFSALAYLTFSLWYSPFAVLSGVAIFYPVWSWRRIEIALNFLRNELDALRQTPVESEFSIGSLQEQLLSLAEIGVLKEYTLNPGETKYKYPNMLCANGILQTGFSVEGESYNLILKSAAAQSKNFSVDLKHIVELLLAEWIAGPAKPTTSYELVGQTIEEIYAIKAVAQQAQMRMNKSMANLQDAVVIIDGTARVIFVNERGKAFFGENLLGQSAMQIKRYIDPFAWAPILKQLMLEQASIYQELDTKDGKRLLCQAASIESEKGSASTLLLFVFTDVTQLRALERSKNEALAFLSHDMRSPIVSQLALIESYKNKLLQENYDPIVDKLADFAQLSLRYAESFLQLSRAENLDQAQFQLIDMHSVVDSAYAQTFQIADVRNIALEIDRCKEECWVEGDANLLERAVTNLLSNAIQYSDDNTRVTLRLTIEESVVLEVIDQGRGIEAEAIPQLFEPYFRAGDTNSDQQKTQEMRNLKASSQSNAGLGLSFVHTVVIRHGGEIAVNSEYGKGSTFSIRLPRADID